jgi:hypothetical protein
MDSKWGHGEQWFGGIGVNLENESTFKHLKMLSRVLSLWGGLWGF